MRIHQILICGMVVVFCIVSSHSYAQYKERLHTLWDSSESNLTLTTSLKNFEVNPDSPLGPRAQLMRAKSYSGRQKKLEQSGLWIKLEGNEFLYENGEIYLLNDSNCTQEEVNPKAFGKSLKKTVKALRLLQKRSEYAYKIIRTLQQSENKFVISIVNCRNSYMLVPISNDRLGVLNNNAYAFQALDRNQNIVDYAPFDRIGSGAEIRWKPEHKKIKLAHELSHAYDANFGLLDDRLTQVKGKIIPARELRAVYHENMIRKELRKNLRVELKNGMEAMVIDDVPYTHPLPVSARH